MIRQGFVHVLFARPCGLRYTIPAERTGQWLIGVNGVAVYLDMRNAIRSRRWMASFDANRGTLLCVSSGSPINPDLTCDERPVSLYSALDVNDSFMTRDGRNECFRSIELDPDWSSIRLICQGDSDGLHFHGALGTEPASLIRINETNLLLR